MHIRLLQHHPRLHRNDSLIGQLVAANVLLVGLTLLAASLAAGFDLAIDGQRTRFLILALAIVLTLCVNMSMLQRRFRPLEGLIDRIEEIDPSEPDSFELEGAPAEEIDRLGQAFKRLLDGIEAERRRAGQLVLRAQEDERRRLARDLHDEVNQALTAILLRLQALSEDAPSEQSAQVKELKLLVNRAMDELTGLARQLRPSALDDHGLVAAIEAQLSSFADRSGVEVSFSTDADVVDLDEDVQTAVYRIVQEALTNVARHADATHVAVALHENGIGKTLTVSDDGEGFDPDPSGAAVRRGRGLGLRGMAERARLAGGELDVRSARGGGTTVTLTLR
jgi:two-component system, NarL family, sensor histidine kinase UhpB